MEKYYANEESSGTDRRELTLPCIHERTATSSVVRVTSNGSRCMQQLLRHIAHEYINEIYQSIKEKVTSIT